MYGMSNEYISRGKRCWEGSMIVYNGIVSFKTNPIGWLLIKHTSDWLNVLLSYVKLLVDINVMFVPPVIVEVSQLINEQLLQPLKLQLFPIMVDFWQFLSIWFDDP